MRLHHIALVVLAVVAPVACSSGSSTVAGDGGTTSQDGSSPADAAAADGPVSADGAVNDGSANGDAGGCPVGGGGPSSQSYTTAAVCSGDVDCTYVMAGCYCGAAPALGIAKTNAAAAATCQKQRADECGLGCPNAPGVSAEDGKSSDDGGVIHVRCEKDASVTGLCRTYL